MLNLPFSVGDSSLFPVTRLAFKCNGTSEKEHDEQNEVLHGMARGR